MLFKKIFHLLYVYFIKFIRNDAFIIFSRKRRYLRNLSKKYSYIDDSFQKIANYYLPKNFFNGEEVVASFGVGSDIEFENQLVNIFNQEIYLFDPTPKSIKYISKTNLSQNINFFPLGISSTAGVHKFYQTKPWSDYTIIKPKKIFDEISVQFIDVEKLINIINKPISMMKLDIEGAAISVVHNILENNLIPEIKIIVAEFEAPMYQQNKNFIEYKQDLESLLELIKIKQWKLFLIPKQKNKYVSLEVVLISN